MSAVSSAEERNPAGLLALNDVRFHWPGDDGFSLAIDAFTLDYGEKLFMRGPSGSGKSTLLSLICGIVRPDSGSIVIDGTDIAQLSPGRADRLRADKLGIIFQQFNLLPYGSMLQNVLLPLQFSSTRRERATTGGTAVSEARRLLERLGLQPALHDRGVTRLSIGQQQRVAVARAMIGNPRLIIADEPTSALDADNRDEFLKLLFEEAERASASLILVSHDPALAASFDRQKDIDEIASTLLPGAT
ncbi:MAG TPA: ABC transporter ATP-binding protein [Gammaproteobacteria bacterium]|jgi:putative ABC transport system ATP-binding protein